MRILYSKFFRLSDGHAIGELSCAHGSTDDIGSGDGMHSLRNIYKIRLHNIISHHCRTYCCHAMPVRGFALHQLSVHSSPLLRVGSFTFWDLRRNRYSAHRGRKIYLTRNRWLLLRCHATLCWHHLYFHLYPPAYWISRLQLKLMNDPSWYYSNYIYAFISFIAHTLSFKLHNFNNLPKIRTLLMIIF